MDTPAALLMSAPRAPGFRLQWTPGGLLIGGTLAMALAAAVGIIAAANMRIDIVGFGRFTVLAAFMAGLWAWCRARKLDPRIGDAALTVGAGTLSLLACGVISNVGLRLGAPTIDAQLATVDALIGINVEAAVRAFADFPALIDGLAFAYNISGAAIVVLIAATIVRGARTLAWELVATVVLSMQAVALVSMAMPAVGAMVHLDMLDLQGAGLPAGAGVYHLEAFARFHSGSEPVLRLSDMSGLVTFPSFHTVLALLATQALSPTRLRWVGVAWTAVVIVSTVPIGGHYVTDLVAGFAIWAGCAWVARRFSNPSA